MSDSLNNELQIKDVQEVTLILFYLYLLDEWLKEYIDWDTLVLLDDISEIAQHKLSDLELVVVLYEEKGQLFVYH